MPPALTPLARRLVVTAFAAGGLLVPAAANGSQVTSVALANGDAVVDRTIVVELQGDATDDGDATVHLNPAGLACADTVSLNRNNKLASDRAWVNPGALGGTRLSIDVDTPGSYTLCAYFDSYPEGSTRPVALPINVRNPNASLSMNLLAAAQPDQEVPLAVTTFSEVSRELWVDVNPEGLPCGLNHEVNNGTNKIWGMALLGGPTRSVVNISMPSSPGRYHLCGYIARSYSDPSPLVAVDSGGFSVGAPPAPPVAPRPKPAPKASCTIGPRAVEARGTLGIRCKNASGTVEIRAKRGGHTVKVTRRLVGGVAKVRVKTLRMKRGVTKISVFQGRAKLAGRSVRRR